MASRVRGIPIEELTREDLPSGYEEEVLEELRKWGASAQSIRLRDEVAINDLLEVLKDTEVAHRRTLAPVARSKSPYVIKYLGPLLYLDDHFGMRNLGEQRDFGYTYSIGETIRALIANSPEFAEGTRDWARTMGQRGFYYTPDLIGGLRQWWEENEEHFENEEFHLVRPGSWFQEGEEISEEEEDTGEIEESLQDSADEEEEARSGAPDTEPDVINEEAKDEGPPAGILIFGGIALVALAGVGVVVARSHRVREIK